MLILSNLFSDHAVFQQGVPVPVWGWSDKNVFVDLTLADGNGTVIAACVGRSSADTGKFSTFFPALPAGGPYSLTAAVRGGETLSFEDIYIGEVWLAGGQSNMEMPLAGFQTPLLYRDKLEFHAPVRMLTVQREMNCMVRENVDSVWTLPEGEELEKWSAAGAYFAAALSRELKVAVGIISVNWGGTIAQAWMSEYALREAGVEAEMLSDDNAELASKTYWDAVQEKGLDFFSRDNDYVQIIKFHAARAWGSICICNEGEKSGWHLPEFDDSSWRQVIAPGVWQNQGIMGGSGVVWFRKKVTVPTEWCGRELVLKTGACDKQDITYVNGIEVGRTGKDFEDEFWNVNRVYSVPADVVAGTELTVAVRVFSFMFQGGMIGPAEEMRLELAGEPSEYVPLDGEWLAGIEYRKKTTTVSGMGNANTYSALYKEMLMPLAPYAVRGAIWYQGESNAEEYTSYRSLMNSLIADWRRLWQNPDMGFYQVLLAGFTQWCNWPELREAQILAARDTATGFASAVDLGDPDDIHPLDKYHVGERLAAAVLQDTYKKDITGYGPEVEEAAWSSDDVKLLCRNASGLHAENGEPGGWEIAGADGVFREAAVEIFGETLLVSHPEVQEPAEVRYAWDIYPAKANLYNDAGLPMIPCRIKR